jgi:hypothetical protein
MTSDGSPYARLQRAIQAGNLALIQAIAAELGYVPLRGGLGILLVIEGLRRSGSTGWLSSAARASGVCERCAVRRPRAALRGVAVRFVTRRRDGGVSLRIHRRCAAARPNFETVANVRGPDGSRLEPAVLGPSVGGLRGSSDRPSMALPGAGCDRVSGRSNGTGGRDLSSPGTAGAGSPWVANRAPRPS